jgi:hypothetical protein
MSQTKLGLYVSDWCRRAVPHGKGWFEFHLFVKTYWQLLSMYKLLVSETTARILEEVAADIKSSNGVEPRWSLEKFQNSRVLVNRLVATNKEEAERILLFLDPHKLESEMDSLWVLREAVAEHEQKLNINLGARLWMEKELMLHKGTQSKPLIGANDAIVFVGQNPSLAIDRFAVKHLEKVVLFPRLILTGRIRSTITECLRAANTSAHLRNGSAEGMEGIAQFLVRDYFNTRQRKLEDKLCHVIACPGRNRGEQGKAMEEFIRICADPHMRVNLMLNQETAEEWIQQPFEYRESQPVLQ